MKEKDTIPAGKPPKLKLGDLIANWAVGRVVSFGLIYRWLGTDDARQTLVDAFDIKFFAVFKAVMLLSTMGAMVLCGVKLVGLWGQIKKWKIVEVEDSPPNPPKQT